MKHRRQHLLLVAVATLAIGVAPAWSATAVAGDQAAPDNALSSAEVTDDATLTEAAGLTESNDPAGATEPTGPVGPATDDVTAPESAVGGSGPTTQPEGPVTPDSEGSRPAVTEAEGEPDGHDGGGHGEGGHLPDGVTVLVDGRAINASDPEGSLPKIASCTFDIQASGLTVEPPDTVGVRIVAWPPTAPGESRVKLVDVTETSTDGTWSGSFPLDETVGQFVRKGNGYHMRLEVLVNGELGAMKMYWLGCGEPQTGNPRRMLFDVQWYDSAGVLVTDALNDVLPAGWREEFALTASGERGTVACSYLPGNDLLNCLYDNPGHGDEPGLVLPGKPGMEYTVKVAGIPDGWAVVAENIGTFLADDTCPKGGGGHHEDGEEGEGGHGEQAACTHTVIINQLVVEPPPDDEGGGGATPPAEEGGGGATPPEGNAALPLTGASTAPLIPVGLALMALGIALVVSSRRRPAVVNA